MSTYVSRWFNKSEMACKCGCGTYLAADALLERLDTLRDAMQRPLIVRSGCRCVDYNIKEGGKPNSAHVTMIGRPCRAVDIQVGTGREAYYLVKEAMDLGFERIGVAVGKGFVHLDVADDLPHPSIWTY